MIGIIGAMEIETRGIQKLLQNAKAEKISGIDFVSGDLNGKQVVCAMCNPGKVNAAICAEAMILKYHPKVIVNSGVAGGLSENLKICDIAIADSVVQHDFDTSALGDEKGLIAGIGLINIACDKRAVQALISASKDYHYECGTIASGDVFISTAAQKSYIKDNFQAIAGEMEGASIGHVCYVNRIPFAVLRVISDGGDNMDFNKFKVISADRSIEIIEEFIALY